MDNNNKIKVGDYWQFKLTNDFTVNAEVIKKDNEGITVELDDKELYLPYEIIESYGNDEKWS